MFKILKILLLIILFSTQSFAEVVNEIKILNNDRISKKTILVFSDIKLGKNYDSNDLNKIIQDLYDTNFFQMFQLISLMEF